MTDMKLKLHILLFIATLLQASVVYASQEVLTISTEDFIEGRVCPLHRLAGWAYSAEYVEGWYRLELDTRDWETLSPSRLSFDRANDQGRVQGWFRLKFRVDSTLWGKEFYLNLVPAGAAEMYLDGKLFEEAGHPDPDRGVDIGAIDFNARINDGYIPKTIRLDSGTYTMAVYCTDHDRYLLDRYTYRKVGAGFGTYLFTRDE